jgi:hypothetical protein
MKRLTLHPYGFVAPAVTNAYHTYSSRIPYAHINGTSRDTLTFHQHGFLNLGSKAGGRAAKTSGEDALTAAQLGARTCLQDGQHAASGAL